MARQWNMQAVISMSVGSCVESLVDYLTVSGCCKPESGYSTTIC